MFESLKNIDQTLLLKINGMHTPFADSFFWLISEGWVFIPVFAFLAFHIFKVKKIKFLLVTMLFVAFTIVFCDQSSNLVKHSVQRYRPTHNLVIGNNVHTVNDYKGGKFGFFSAHASNSFGVSVFLFLCLSWVQRKYRWLIFIWPLLSGYSRIYLGVHYPSDILFGFLDGLLWGIVFYKVFDKVFLKANESAV